LAARRADTGDYSAVAVLWPLTPDDPDRPTLNQALPLAGLVFSQNPRVEIRKAAGFFARFPI
jgi:hypothetical protein